MILSAYERRGEAKLFSDEEMIRALIRPVKPSYSPSTGVSSRSSEFIIATPPSEDTKIPSRPSARAVRLVGRFVLRRIGFRLIPYLGWALLAKDIYDLATD